MTAIISEFQIDQFGGGNPLRVLDLGNGLNVALARSERGQRQLLNVIPCTLNGKQFVPPVPGDQSGELDGHSASAVLLRTDNGVFTVRRNWVDGQVRIIAADGSEFDSDKMSSLLDNIGYSRYRRVFTFSLARLAQFASGEETEYLVKMADYLRRKSPNVEVPVVAPLSSIGELRAVYSGLGQLTALMQQEAETAAPIVEEEEPRDRKKLSQDLKKVESSLTDGRARYEHLESELDETRAALTFNRATQHLAAVQTELAELESRRTNYESDAGTRNSLDRLVAKLDDCKLQLQQLKEEYNDIRRQTKELSNRRRGAKSVAQIEAMLLHEKSLIREEEAIEQLKLRIQDVETKLEVSRDSASTSNEFSGLSDSQTRARMDDLADRIRDAERELEMAEQTRLRAQSIPISTASAALHPTVRPEDAVAVHEAEQHVLQLRERLGLDEQLARLEAERANLMAQVRRLYSNQLMPFPMVMALGVPFMVGVGMVLYSLFMTNGLVNWQLVMFGFAIAMFTSLIKMSMDRGSVEMLDSTRGRLARVDHQIEQFLGARADGETSGSLQHELEMAERRLTELHANYSPTGAQPAIHAFESGPSLESAQLQLNSTHQRLRDLKHDWQQLLVQLGLPATLTPNKAREAIADRAIMAARSGGVSEYDQLNSQLTQLRNEETRRQDWLNVLGSQARQLVKELGFSSGSGTMPEQFDALRDALRDAREVSATKKQLHRDLKRIRLKRDQLKESGRRFAEQHRRLQDELKLKKERAKSKDLMSNERAKLLQEQRERLEQEIEEIRERYRLESQSAIADQSDEELEQRLQHQADQLEKLRDKLLKYAEQRGRVRALLSADAPQVKDDTRTVFDAIRQRTESLAHQLKTAAKQAELDALAQAQAAIGQPEYLQRAGNYLADLSDGDFGRIELFDGQPGLGLVNQHGQLVPLNQVDRQHYPNLYFSLWLAQLESYVDRGYHLPAIVEDPLVATKRARQPVVAELLRDFGIRGRQIIVVTADGASADVYGHLGVPIADLSDRLVVNDEMPHSEGNGNRQHDDDASEWRHEPDRPSFSPLG